MNMINDFIDVFLLGKGAKMILNFTLKCICNTKISRGAQIVPTWDPGVNIIFSHKGNKF